MTPRSGAIALDDALAGLGCANFPGHVANRQPQRNLNSKLAPLDAETAPDAGRNGAVRVQFASQRHGSREVVSSFYNSSIRAAQTARFGSLGAISFKRSSAFCAPALSLLA